MLLLGDGSFNYKGGTAQGNYVPTQIMFKDILDTGVIRQLVQGVPEGLATTVAV